VGSFETFPEQEEAKRLLAAALAEGTAHAYLFHGPPGVGKRDAALAFAGELLGDPARVARNAHPDLYVLEPLGDQIRIDPIRELRRDLHMRPFEAEWRVYLVFGANLMNEDAADALLKDLEEPPPYAVIVLVADELGSLPETIRSRCQLVPFRRLSRGAVKTHLAARGLSGEALEIAARVAAGRRDRAERLLDPKAVERRGAVLDLARSAYRDEAFEPAQAARLVGELAAARAAETRTTLEHEAEEAREVGLEEQKRDLDQRLKRAERGAEREEVLAALDTLASWYRDLVVVGAGAEAAALNSDRLAELGEDARPDASERAAKAAEIVRDVWRSFEFNVQTGLALEALFVRLRRVFV
jgi:DNA polymerase-3 subunit delta'